VQKNIGKEMLVELHVFYHKKISVEFETNPERGILHLSSTCRILTSKTGLTMVYKTKARLTLQFKRIDDVDWGGGCFQGGLLFFAHSL
jgi:hypothetical protein